MNLTSYLEKGYNYSDYLKKIEDQLYDLEKTGDEKGFAKYYSMNLKRIERLDKSFELNENQKNKLKEINPNFQLLIITEGWCGDAAQVLPVVNKMMEEIGVEQKFVFRDINPELMDEYLTDGARSIPILIGVDGSGKEIFRYGPRPKEGMEMLKKHKANPEIYTDDEFHKDLQIWYNQNKGESIFNELSELLVEVL